MAVDAELEQGRADVLRRLREQYAAGALSLDELTGRVGRAYAALTRAELDELVSDLSSFPALPPPGSEVVVPHLVHGEQVLWVGRPDPRKRFAKSDLYALPFSLLWAGFAFFWEITVIASGSIPFALFGIPFVLVGLYITVGRFFAQTRIKARTWYAVTNRRVLAVERKRSGDVVDAAFIDGLPAISRDVRSDGSGSVLFGPAKARRSAFEFGGDQSAQLGFYDIPDAARVAELVTQLRQERPES
jgi:hypothetical protein